MRQSLLLQSKGHQGPEAGQGEGRPRFNGPIQKLTSLRGVAAMGQHESADRLKTEKRRLQQP